MEVYVLILYLASPRSSCCLLLHLIIVCGVFFYMGHSWLRRNCLIHMKGWAHCLHVMKVFLWQYIEILFHITAQDIPRSPYIYVQTSTSILVSRTQFTACSLIIYMHVPIFSGCLEPLNECLAVSFLDRRTFCGVLVQKTIREWQWPRKSRTEVLIISI